MHVGASSGVSPPTCHGLGFPRYQPFMDPLPPDFSVLSEGLPFFDGEVEGTPVTFRGIFEPHKGLQASDMD